jgi:hypothetical protein
MLHEQQHLQAPCYRLLATRSNGRLSLPLSAALRRAVWLCGDGRWRVSAVRRACCCCTASGWRRTCRPRSSSSTSLASSLLSVSDSATSASPASVAAALPSPVRTVRGRHCLDVCITRYLDAMEHTRGRLERQVLTAMRVERDSRGNRGQRESESEDAGSPMQRLGTASRGEGGGGQHSAAVSVKDEGGKAQAQRQRSDRTGS